MDDDIKIISVVRHVWMVTEHDRVVCTCDGNNSHNDAAHIAAGLRALRSLPVVEAQNQALAEVVGG